MSPTNGFPGLGMTVCGSPGHAAVGAGWLALGGGACFRWRERATIPRSPRHVDAVNESGQTEPSGRKTSSAFPQVSAP